MEPTTAITYKQPSTSSQVLAAAGPMLWVAVSYVDPGKWAAVVDTGANLGYDMALLMLIMNCAAILCQYLSARVAIATGKDLAQICSKEYGNVTCILLGIEAEISMILLDLTMVLGTAYGLNVMFGIDLFNCVFLTGFDVIIFPFLASFLETTKAKFVSVCLASFILVSYFCGVLVSQPESSLSLGRMLDKLSGENAYALMSVLGASIMPHNFYLHSSIVQQVQGQTVVSKEALCHYHFFATLCIFSGICLANCMLMNLAASVFYNSGFVSLTLQDALSLLEQVSTSSIASFALLLYMFFSNHLIALTWSIGGRSIGQDLFRLEIPGWLHRATIRIIAIIPALYCVWNLGAEGVYQLLIFTQVAVAILLPSSVVPLFRVASCRSIMGVYKASQLVEVLAFVSFFGMLGLKIVFVMEMIFGGSDWVSGLKQNLVSGVPTLYLILLMGAFASLFLMLFLVTTPLKSATVGVDTEGLRWDEKAATPESSLGRSKPEISEVPFHPEKTVEKQEPALQLDKDITDTPDVSTLCSDLNLPETLLDFDSNLPLTVIRDSKAKTISSMTATHSLDESTDFQETPLIEPGKVIERDFRDTTILNTEVKDMGEKTSRMEVNLQNDKVDDLSSWEHEELVKDVSARGQSFESDDPVSLRSISSKVDDIGSGTGSLSRLAGLGRAARRQLTVTLEEFWGQLFGYHGQATDEAKSKKLDVLIGVDSRMDSKSSVASVKLESKSKQMSGSVASMDGTGLDSFRSSSISSSLNQQYSQGTVGSPIAVQQKPSDLSKTMQPLDPYGRNSSFNTVNFGERRYYSVHSPSSFVGHDQQPATIHGYDLSAYQGQIVKEGGSDFPKSRLESEIQNSAPSVISNLTNSYGRPSAQKPLGGLRNFTPPGFHNIPAARNTALKSERHLNDRYSPEIVDHTGNPPDVKKFYSLPDISGLYAPQREFSPSGNSPRHGKSMIYGQSISRPAREQSASSWSGAAFGFNDLSPSKVCRDAFSLQYSSNSGASSLWSRQPYERFGVADNSPPKVPDSSSIMDIEAKLLQSFRSCIMKLLKLEGSEWLFSQNDGADEDIIARVAAREKFLYDVEHSALDRKLSSAMQINEAEQTKSMSVPNCGEGCVWGVDLIISFGVWSIHRILDLSLIESRPELWGKYTYVLNRLQGIIEPAYSKPRSLPTPCFCLQLPAGYQQKCSPPKSNGRLPPPPKLGAGKFTTAAMLLDMIKDVELAISSRKGRTGTAAGDVAFPKGKENLASVLKRYKRRLANKAAFVSPESATLQQRKVSSYSQGL